MTTIYFWLIAPGRSITGPAWAARIARIAR